MWQRLGDHSPYVDLDITNDRITRWHPLNQSLYVGYKVMLAGPADDLQGRPHRHELVGRDPVSVPRRRRDRVLRGDRPGVQAARDDREVDPPPGRRAASCPRRSPTGPRRCSAPAWRRPSSDPTARPGSTSSSAPSRCARRAISTSPRCSTSGRCRPSCPAITPARFVFDVALTCVVSTQLWHHIYCGGGLCDLPAWQPPVIDAVRAEKERPSVGSGWVKTE